MTNEELRNALALVASQNSKLLTKAKRDNWDKFAIFAPLLTGLIITITSLYITHRFETVQKENETRKIEADKKAAAEADKLRNEIAARERQWQQRLARTELLNKFMPYLAGNDQQASMAIVAISITGDTDLMDAVSRMAPSKGAKEALARVATTGVTQEVRTRASTTLNLLETLERAKPSLQNPIKSIRARALQVALDELKRGVKENPPGSNRGADIDKYNQFSHVPDGSPWSGSFLCWCYSQAVNQDGELPVKLSPSFAETMNQLAQAGRWRPKESGYKPQPGDIALFQWSASAFHGGIVVNVDDTYVYTIEGNTSPSDDVPRGEAVAGKARLLTWVKGYGDMGIDTQ